MHTDEKIEAFFQRMNIVNRTLAHLEGRRDQLLIRDNELMNSVGLAKGRIEQKPLRDEFLEKLQTKWMGDSVDRYAKLLTALVRDVVPGERSVGLELYTHSGLPALDIYTTQGKSSTRFDIVDQESGAVTNSVCLGLRVIATINSGLRKFLLLDEPDCWVEGDNVRSFYKVLTQLATHRDWNDVQILVVSHQPVGFFAAGTNIIQVIETDTGIRVEQLEGAREWDSDQTPGIRSIHLKNVATYRDVVIPLAPGLNIVRGDNGSGKSRLSRHVRSVMYGGSEANDADIRLGETVASSQWVFEGGRELHWSKQKEKNPSWRLFKDGEIVVLDGERCETLRQKVAPSWLSKNGAAGIGRVAGLDIQIAHQKEPVFLLKETNTKRAMVLSIGRESNRLQHMIASEKENHSKDRELVKSGETEISSIRQQLAFMSSLEDIRARWEKEHLVCKEIEEQNLKLARMENIVVQVSGLEKDLEQCLEQAGIVSGLSSYPVISEQIKTNQLLQAVGKKIKSLGDSLKKYAEQVRALNILKDPPELKELETMSHVLNKIQGTQKLLKNSVEISKVLSILNDQAPIIQPTENMRSYKDKISNLILKESQLAVQTSVLKQLCKKEPVLQDLSVLEESIKKITQNQDDFDKTDKNLIETRLDMQTRAMEVADLVESMGNQCPLCGSHVAHNHILSHT